MGDLLSSVGSEEGVCVDPSRRITSQVIPIAREGYPKKVQRELVQVECEVGLSTHDF